MKVNFLSSDKNDNARNNAVENNEEYLKLAEENILKNYFNKKIKLVNENIFNVNRNLTNYFDIVVSNPPYHSADGKLSNNILRDTSKRIIDLEKWLQISISLLKNKGTLSLYFSYRYSS